MQAQAKSQIRLGERMTQKPLITLMHPLTKKTNKVGSENNTKATYNNEAAPNKEPDKVGSENETKANTNANAASNKKPYKVGS